MYRMPLKMRKNYYCTSTVGSQNRMNKQCRPGLEKLTNANRSVSSVSDGLFPVELTEIADSKCISEYMLHANFGKP